VLTLSISSGSGGLRIKVKDAHTWNIPTPKTPSQPVKLQKKVSDLQKDMENDRRTNQRSGRDAARRQQQPRNRADAGMTYDQVGTAVFRARQRNILPQAKANVRRA
jgi:hypothetical protein